MRPGQQLYLGRQRPDRRRVAPIRADTLVQDPAAHQRAQLVLERPRDRARLVFLAQRFDQLVAQRVEHVDPLRLDHRAVDRLAQLVAQLLPHRFDQPFRLFLHFEGALFLAQRLGHVALHADRILHRRVPALDRLEHHLFAHLVGRRFDHQDRVLRPGQAQVQRALFHLLDRRVKDILPVDIADAHRAHRPVERGVRDRQRRRCGNDVQDIGLVFLVLGEGVGDHLHFVAHALGKERAQGTVGQARRQDRVLAGASFAAEERARDAACGIQPRLKVDREREKVDPFAHRARHRRCRKQHRVATADRHGAAGLLGQLAGLDDDLLLADHRLVRMLLLHCKKAS